MIYGNVRKFLSKVEEEWRDRIKHASEDFIYRKERLIKEYKERLKREKDALKREFASKFEKEKENMLIAFKLKKLQEIENIKIDLIDDIIQRVKDRVHKEKEKKSKLYFNILVFLIKDGMKQLNSNNVKVQLSNNDCTFKKRLSSIFKNIKFDCVDKDYDGVVVLSNSEDTYVNNIIDEICKDKYSKLYSIVDREIKWEK